MQAPNLARARFDNNVAECDLAVAAEGDFVATSHRENGRTVKLFHEGGVWGVPHLFKIGNASLAGQPSAGGLEPRLALAGANLGNLVQAHDHHECVDKIVWFHKQNAFVGIAHIDDFVE
jgi:hypothetical protein